MKTFIYLTYSFLLQLPSLPNHPLLINCIFSWKSKLKHTDVDITCFFQDKILTYTMHTPPLSLGGLRPET